MTDTPTTAVPAVPAVGGLFHLAFPVHDLDAARAFYEKYGGVTLIAARFMPFVRTFAPFVAGVAQMTRRKFTFFDITGAMLWVGGVVTAGYLFGNLPWVKKHLDLIIWAAIFIPGGLVLLGAWRAQRRQRLATAGPGTVATPGAALAARHPAVAPAAADTPSERT